MPRKHKQTPEEKEKFRTGQRNKAGKVICGAKTRPGNPCSSQYVCPNGRCRMHGGTTPSGVNAGNFKTGRWSKYLPTRMVADHEEFLSNPDKLHSDHELAVVDSRIADLFKRVDGGESGSIWVSVKKEFENFKAANSAEDTVKAIASLTIIDSLINKGAGDYMAWSEIMELIDRRVKIAESEQKRMIQLKQYLTYEKALLLVGSLQAILKRHITDPVTMRAIGNDIRVVTGGSTSPQAIGSQVAESEELSDYEKSVAFKPLMDVR